MKGYDKRPMALALFAGLLAACGTSSPTAVEVNTLGAFATTSELRRTPRPAAAIPASPVPAPQSADLAPPTCQASDARVLILRGSLPQPLYGDSVLLQMVMIGKDGLEIADASCRGIAWSFVAVGYVAGPTIVVSRDTRYATVSGLAGRYAIRALTPNGLEDTIDITLP